MNFLVSSRMLARRWRGPADEGVAQLPVGTLILGALDPFVLVVAHQVVVEALDAVGRQAEQVVVGVHQLQEHHGPLRVPAGGGNGVHGGGAAVGGQVGLAGADDHGAVPAGDFGVFLVGGDADVAEIGDHPGVVEGGAGGQDVRIDDPGHLEPGFGVDDLAELVGVILVEHLGVGFLGRGHAGEQKGTQGLPAHGLLVVVEPVGGGGEVVVVVALGGFALLDPDHEVGQGGKVGDLVAAVFFIILLFTT